jgi:hypothetical protein
MAVVCSIGVLGIEALWSAAAWRDLRVSPGDSQTVFVNAPGLRADVSRRWGVQTGTAARTRLISSALVGVVVRSDAALPQEVRERLSTNRRRFEWIEAGPLLPSFLFDCTNAQAFGIRPARFVAKGIGAAALFVLAGSMRRRDRVRTAAPRRPWSAESARVPGTLALGSLAVLCLSSVIIIAPRQHAATEVHGSRRLSWDDRPAWMPRVAHRGSATFIYPPAPASRSKISRSKYKDWLPLIDRFTIPAPPNTVVRLEVISLRGYGIARPAVLAATYVGKTEYGVSWSGVAWNLAALAGLAALVWCVARVTADVRRARRLRRGLCPTCAYPCPGGLCTECGWSAMPRDAAITAAQ